MKKYKNPKTGETMIDDGNGTIMPEKAYLNKYGQLPNTQRPQERVQTFQQTQANLQMADDTWERLIRALERFEMVTDETKPMQSAIRQNFHRHQNEMPESVYDAELEVHLQILAFSHVVAPVRGDKKTVPWLLRDFIGWLGGREQVNPHSGPTDRYAIPVIKCILGEQPLELPEMLKTSKQLVEQALSEQEMQKTVEQIGTGLTEGDKIIDDFAQNPDKQATQHTHLRGSLQDGKVRLEKIAKGSKQKPWLTRFFNEYGVNIE